MIAHLKGVLSNRTQNEVVIDVSGVGYLLQMSTSDIALLPNLEEEVFVHVLTHVRDSAMTLFGFIEPNTRAVFSRLISISGVGPKLALAILSTLSLQQLWDAANSGSTQGLKRVPGVGPKKARRLALELKDALNKLNIAFATPATPSKSKKSGSPSSTPSAPPGQIGRAWGDLESALYNLGYPPARVDDIIAGMQQEIAPESSFSVLLKEALKRL